MTWSSAISNLMILFSIQLIFLLCEINKRKWLYLGGKYSICGGNYSIFRKKEDFPHYLGVLNLCKSSSGDNSSPCAMVSKVVNAIFTFPFSIR